MKRPNITPGPWTVRQADCVYSDIKGRFVCDCERTPFDKRPAPPDAQDGSNAQAIAALPDLLAALEKMLEAYAPYHQETVNHRGGEDGLHSAVKAARAALTLAGYTFDK